MPGNQALEVEGGVEGVQGAPPVEAEMGGM